MNQIFRPADILLPKQADMQCWSVIACDQFTSDAAYWAAVEQTGGGAPSTLRLMLPEFYLGKRDEAAAAAEIQQTMRRYLDNDVFTEIMIGIRILIIRNKILSPCLVGEDVDTHGCQI